MAITTSTSSWFYNTCTKPVSLNVHIMSPIECQSIHSHRIVIRSCRGVITVKAFFYILPLIQHQQAVHKRFITKIIQFLYIFVWNICHQFSCALCLYHILIFKCINSRLPFVYLYVFEYLLRKCKEMR